MLNVTKYPTLDEAIGASTSGEVIVMHTDQTFSPMYAADVAKDALRRGHLKLVAPTEVKRTVRPKRQKNADLRTREHFTPDEVESLLEAAQGNRHGHRDATMVLLTYRHGLRAAEVCDLRWDQVDFAGAVLHVRRVKNGTPSTHPDPGR
jgi:integrase